MTSGEFLGKLMQRFKIDDELLKDLTGYINRVPQDKLPDLWEKFLQSYGYRKAPAVADIAKLAQELNIMQKRKEFFYFICSVCGTRYSITGRGCPVCREMTRVSVGAAEKRPGDLVSVRQDCWMCRHYSQYAQGPTCSEYGSGPISGREECIGCVCRKCCKEFSILRENPGLYQSIFQSGKLEDRYLVNKKERHEKAG